MCYFDFGKPCAGLSVRRACRSELLVATMQKCMILFCQQHKLCYFCTEYTVNWGSCISWSCNNPREYIWIITFKHYG